LDLTKSSYDFHCGLESPLSFFRREWKAIAIFGGGFCLILLLGIIWLDPAFYYPRLQTDPLLYLLKAKSLVETGSTAARMAVNAPPFPYAAMPGVLRAPMLLAFSDFDDQWRAIQVLNIPIVASVALMSAYIVSWSLPAPKHWMAIGFAFAFTLLSPMWMTNVYSPLADAPYAAFSLLSILIVVQVICKGSIRKSPVFVALFCLLFVVVFMLRFTGPVLLVFTATLASGRRRLRDFSPGLRSALIVLPVAAVVLLVLLNFQAIFGRYLLEPVAFAHRGDKTGMFLNLFGVALPDQIIPDFHLALSHPPVINIYHSEFGSTRADKVWTGIGILISAITGFGLWRSRSRMLPEILYVLAPLPVLTLMMPSTSRYLMSYQAFFWLFFYEGASDIRRRLTGVVSIPARVRFIIAAGGLAVVAVVTWLRWNRIAGTAADRSYAVSMTRLPDYVQGVSTDFRSLRNYISTLPKDSTLLIGSRETMGRWSVISDRSYYLPDSGLTSVSRKKEVYLVVECGTIEYCQVFSEMKSRLQERLCDFGEFKYDSVFAVRSKWARAEVYRVRPAS
jgi:hypothetical protein